MPVPALAALQVVMFLLLERTRDKVFLPLQGIIMRQNLHRQFMSLMQPHLDGTQQQVRCLIGIVRCCAPVGGP